MRSKKQTVFSKNMHQETNLNRPGHFDRGGPAPIKQFHHMRCQDIFWDLMHVEREITQKLQKLKMECLGDDMMNDETQTVLSYGTYKDEKPVSMYYLAIEEKNIYFEIPKSPEAFSKLWQEELEIIQKLQKLKLNQVKLDHKKKLFYLRYSHYKSDTIRKIEWKVEEIEELKQSFHELYVSKRPRQRKDSDISPLHDEQIVKLHNGRHHGSKNLAKERQLIKKINQAKGEVEKIISANSPSEPVTRIYTWGGDILDTKEALADYIKVSSREVEELRMKQMRYRAYDGRAELEKAATEKEIMILERKLDIINHKKSKLASKPQLAAQI